MKTYFKFKLRKEYLPEFVKDYVKEGKIIIELQRNDYSDILSVGTKYIRKLKIKKIEKNISKEDLEFLDFVTNEKLIHYLTKEEHDAISNRISTRTTTILPSMNDYSIKWKSSDDEDWRFGNGNIYSFR